MRLGVGRTRSRGRPTSHGLEPARSRACAAASAARVSACAAPAFTLLEVMITLGLLVLLAGLAWPALQTQITAAELPESADRLRSALFMARCEAMMQHRRFRVRFAPDEQHPMIEWESDPVNQPGVFVPATVDWADEQILLANVQVHEIRPGRPVYLQALSETSDPDSLLKEAEERERERVERENLNRGEGFGASQDQEVDPLRPVIIFEPDGSTDWATLVLARVSPSEPLEEEEPQVWIVIDGRTGLVMIRDKVTQEQLSDAKFYVLREKLELPDLANTDDLSFDVGGDSVAGTGESAASSGMEETASTGGSEEIQGLAEAAAQVVGGSRATGASQVSGASQTGGTAETSEADTRTEIEEDPDADRVSDRVRKQRR